MTERTFHKGPPPFPGWWNARVKPFRDLDRWGWWDGARWSVFSAEELSAKDAAKRAKEVGADNGSAAHVEWSDYWPDGARVPRVDPRQPAQAQVGELQLITNDGTLKQRIVHAQAKMLLETAASLGMNVTVSRRVQPLNPRDAVFTVDVWPVREEA